MKKYRNVNTGRIILPVIIVLLLPVGIWKLSRPEIYAKSVLTNIDLKQIQDETIDLPCVIPETDLLAQHLVCYEGPFIEDGSDVFVVDTAALSVKNIGRTGIEAAKILLVRGDEFLCFNITNLPPGDTVLVLEENRAQYKKGKYAVYSGWQTISDLQWVSMDEIRVTETGMAELDLTNQTDRVIPNIQICYKNYLSDGDILIGGVTNRVWLGTLQPGQTVSISLPRYASGYSKIVCMKSG